MTVIKHFQKLFIEYKIGVDTSKMSSIRAGGIAFAAVFPKNTSELINVIKILKAEGMPYKIIGGATNIFFSDEMYDGVIISLKNISGADICVNNNVDIDVYTGTSISKLIKSSAELGIELSSSLFGIPGTVGGAVRNNAGAFGSEIADIFISGTFIDTDTMSLNYLSHSDLNFSYRHSVLQKENLIFLCGKFRGKLKDKQSILEDIEKIKNERINSQPSLPSLGSFYKRHGLLPVSKLIDEAGLKGFSVGGAEISKKHAGFIINSCGATSRDIVTLANYIEKMIKEKFGVNLIREAEFVN